MNNLSEFIREAQAEKISDENSYNWRVRVDCPELSSGIIDVTAENEYSAKENAYLYVMSKREENLMRN